MLRIFIFILLSLFASEANAKILAKVNDEVITEQDVINQAALINNANKTSYSLSDKNFKKKIINEIIKIKLYLYEAERLGLEVSEAEIELYFNESRRQNPNLPNNRIAREAVKAEYLWSKIVEELGGITKQVSEREVDELIHTMKNKAQPVIKRVSFKQIIANNDLSKLKGCNCNNLEAIALQNNLPKPDSFLIKPEEMNPDILNVLMQLGVGKLSIPLELSNGSKMLLILCGLETEKTSQEFNRAEIKEFIRRHKIVQASGKMLEELKHKSYIEIYE